MDHYEMIDNDLTVSDDSERIDFNYTYELLRKTYWGKDLPYSRFEKGATHSLCYGLYLHEKQIGFARVVTDFSETASIWDIVIDEAYRGKGYGKKLVDAILASPKTAEVFKWFLMTEDAFGLYQRYGFTSEQHPFVMTKISDPTF